MTFELTRRNKRSAEKIKTRTEHHYAQFHWYIDLYIFLMRNSVYKRLLLGGSAADSYTRGTLVCIPGVKLSYNTVGYRYA